MSRCRATVRRIDREALSKRGNPVRYWMVFDAETVPDAELGRRWLKVGPEVNDTDVRQLMLDKRLADTGGQSNFLKPPFHRVVAIAAALIDENGAIRRLGPVGEESDGEAHTLRVFFQVIAELSPRLVGWNSAGFDIPMLLYRAMRHGIATPAFYRIGEPYHGYRKRFDEDSHLDLMDMLSGYGASPRATLDEAACLVGVPGKLEVDGNDVTRLFEDGDLARIRQYCSHDVLTTTLIFMHYAYHRGWLDDDGRHTLEHSARRWVAEDQDGLWGPFQRAWQAVDATRN